MKLKGINSFEQHAEKIVVGVAGAAALGIVALQFLHQPNMVTVGKSAQPVKPAEAFVPVEAAAEALQGKLNAEVTSFPEVPKLTLVDRLAGGFAASGGPKPRAIAMGNPPSITIDAATQVASDTFGLPSVPPAVNVAAAAFQSTISPIEQVRNTELAALLPPQQPFDKAAVSVEGTFNGLTLREALAADPDGDGPMSPIPTSWWRDPLDRGNDLLQVVGVELERQTVTNADGSSGGNKTVLISGMPGRTDVLKLWRESVAAAGDVGPMLEQIWSTTDLIQRPDYYASIAGPEWIPPSEVEDVTADSSDDRMNERDLRADQADRAKLVDLDARILRAPDAKANDRRDNRDDRPPPPPSRGGKGLTGGGADRQDPREKDRDNGPTRQVLERQRAALVANMERRRERLKSRGVEVAAAASETAPLTAAPHLGLLDNPEVKVWGHDVTAERGAVYRYRLRVVTNNPLFGRSLQPTQARLAAENTIAAPWSDWSAPVTVLPSEYYFVTSAESRSDITPRPRATAELFVYYYGFYRKASVSLEPGDKLMATAKLPELKFADMDLLKADPSAELAPLPGAASPRDPGPGGGGGKGLMPGGPSPRGGRGEGAPAPTGEPRTSDPILTIAAPKERAMMVDATFLDVAQAPTAPSEVAGADRTRYFAVLRNSAGQLVTRLAEVERSQGFYGQFEASAKAGLTQGVPVVLPEAERQFVPKPREPRTKPPEEGGGGGGGG